MRKLSSLLMSMLALFVLAIPVSAQDLAPKNEVSAQLEAQGGLPEGWMYVRDEGRSVDLNLVPQSIPGMIFKDRVSTYAQFRAAQDQTPVFAPPVMGTFYGLLNASLTGDVPSGIYEYPQVAPFSTASIQTGSGYNFQGGCMISENKMFFTNYVQTSSSVSNVVAGILNLDTWEVEKTASGWEYWAQAFAYDKETGRVYGRFGKVQGTGVYRKVGYCDLETLEVTIIDSDSYFVGLGQAKDGKLYYVSGDGKFGTMDKESGATTIISENAPTSYYDSNGTINPYTNTFYYATLNPEPQGAQLWSIDLTTGESSLVYQRGDGGQLCGLLFPFALADPKGPARPTIDSIEHDGFSLSGVIKFTAPTTYFDGSAPAKGEILNYRILANDQQIAYGTNIEYGKSYSVSITVPASGLYEFKVILTNGASDSPYAAATKFVGEDVPAAPANVVAAYADGTMSLTWDPVTDGAQGGAFSGTVTYEVYDAINNELLAEGISGTSYQMAFEAPESRTNFQYAVIAVVKGNESEAGYSNIVTLGDYLAPWTCPFSAASDMNGWTIIDANGDGKKWTYNSGGFVRMGYNSSKDMDDWLISPAIVLEANYLYEVAMEARMNSRYPERVALYWGTEPTAEAMTNLLVEPTVLTSTSFVKFSAQIMAEARGKVYFGIHGCSDKDMYNLDVRNFSISEGLYGMVPASATDVNAVVSYTGETSATISYKTPTTIVSGEEINEDTKLTKVEIYVNGELEYHDNAPISGAVSHFTFEAPYDGYYNFEVIAYNKYGAGLAAKINVFIGINTPGVPLNPKATEVSEGVVDITWDAPETDVDGNIFNPEFITYTVVMPKEDGSFEILAEGISETAVRGYRVCEAGEQKFVNFEIYAESSYGMNETPADTGLAPFGTPYDTPFIESYANGIIEHEFVYGSNGWAYIQMCTDNTFNDLTSRNLDNGFLAIRNYYTGLGYNGIMLIESGKIAITDDDAAIEYYSVYLGVDNTIQTVVICDGESTIVDTHSTKVDPVLKWGKVEIPIGQYAGKTIQVQFFISTTTLALFDDIRIGKPLQQDLKAESISAPEMVKTETDFEVEYTISNYGAAKVAANAYTISLYNEGDLVGTIDNLPEIEPGQTQTGTFAVPAFDLFMTGSTSYNYVINFAADEDQTNNSSEVANVAVVNNNLPTVNLNGELNAAGNAVLTWDTPAIDITSGTEQQEGFESTSYPAFSYDSFGEWTLYSGNTSATGYPSNLGFPNKGYAGGWILFDAESQDLLSNSTYGPSDEGRCYLAAFYHKDKKSNNAWLISPELTGVAQTITFEAKGVNSKYVETLDCYYSTTGTATEDFIQVEIDGYDGGLTTTWTQYSFDIPEGAKYFAIVSTSADMYATLLDNITYIGGISEFANLEHVGYNIYRDEELLTSVGVAVNKYVDTSASEGSHYYNVTAVYNDGQSAPSNTVKLTKQSTTSLEAVDAASAVAVEGKEIVVTGAETVVIAAVDGKVVYDGVGEARVAVAAGVYVVKTNDQVVKVVVK